MGCQEKRKRGIETLPDNLFEAVKFMEKSSLVKETLGNHVFEKFIENKHIEWDRYRTYVTNYEIDNYLLFFNKVFQAESSFSKKLQPKKDKLSSLC